MGFFRRPDGTTVEIPDEQIGTAIDSGFEPITHAEHLTSLDARAAQPDGEGLVGAINAGATSFLSGATLGASDVVLGSLMTEGERKRLYQSREAHDVVSGISNVAGNLAPILLSGGAAAAATPASIVSRGAARIAETGAELGGLARMGGAIAGGAYEGAAQMAGSYLSDVALSDRELSAEGFVGAVSSGALLGGAIGGGSSVLEAGASKGWAKVKDLFPAHEAAGDVTRAAESKFHDELGAVIADSETLEQAAQHKLEELRLRAMENDVSVKERHIALRNEQADLRVQAQREAAARQAEKEATAPARDAVADRRAAVRDEMDQLKLSQEREKLGARTAQREAAEARAARAKTGPQPRTKAPESDAPAKGTGVAEDSTLPPVADDVNDPLMAQLRGTQRELEGGADLGALSRRHLEAADDEVMRSTEGKINQQIDDHIAAGDPEFARVRDATENLSAARSRLDDWMSKYGKGGKVGRFERSGAARETADSWRSQESGWKTSVPEGEGNIGLARGRETTFRGTEAERAAAEAEITQKYAGSRTLEEHIAQGSKVKGTATPEEVADISAHQMRERATAAEDLAARGKPVDGAIRDRIMKAAGEQAAGSAAKEALPAGVGKIAADNIGDIAEAVEVIGNYERAVAEAMNVVNPMEPLPAASRVSAGMKDAAGKHEAAQLWNATESAEAAARASGSPEARAALDAARTRTDAAESALDSARGQAEATDLELARAKLEHGKAKAETQRLKGVQADRAKAMDAVSLPKAPESKGLLGKAADIGTVLEVLSTLGVPGVPHPRDIPVIGPLLGMFLKARAAATVWRRLGGKVPVSAETRIASASASMRTRAVQTVKRVIDLGGVAAKGMKRAAIPTATTILSRKLLDDSHDGDEPKAKASPVERRVAEIAAYTTNRDTHLAQIKQALPTRDPSIVQAVADAFDRKMQYLDKIAPKDPRPPMLVKSKWNVPPGKVESFARAVRALEDPASVFDDLERGVCTPEATEAVRSVYPRIFAEAQQALVTQAPELLEKLSYAARQNLAALFDVPLDATHTPQYLSWISEPSGAVSAPSTSQPGQQPAPGSPPQPGIVADVSLSQSVMTSADRRAMR